MSRRTRSTTLHERSRITKSRTDFGYAGCVQSDPNKICNSATMPPSGRTMTDAELEILRQWIADGANP